MFSSATFLDISTNASLEKTSIARKLACLRTFFKFLVRDRRLKSNPAELISSPRLPKKLPSPLQENEAAIVVEVPQGDSLKDLRDRAILELLYASGLRVRELAGLNDENIDLRAAACPRVWQGTETARRSFWRLCRPRADRVPGGAGSHGRRRAGR